MTKRARPVPRRSVEPSACLSSSEARYSIRSLQNDRRLVRYRAGGHMKAGAVVLLAVFPPSSPWNFQAPPSFARHYDANKPVTLVGTVTKVEWTNPHARFY